MFLEREAESLQKGVSLFVGLGGGHEGDLHTVDTGVLVNLDFREDNLQLDQSFCFLFLDRRPEDARYPIVNK